MNPPETPYMNLKESAGLTEAGCTNYFDRSFGIVPNSDGSPTLSSTDISESDVMQIIYQSTHVKNLFNKVRVALEVDYPLLYKVR